MEQIDYNEPSLALVSIGSTTDYKLRGETTANTRVTPLIVYYSGSNY